MEKKTTKPTNAQLQRRIEKAVVHIDRTKELKEIYFSDKGLRLQVSDGFAVISTGHHKHIFDYIAGNGVSRPWIYTNRVVEIALENECKTDSGYSFTKLLETLKAKEDQAEYNICVFAEWWIFNCFQPLFSIGETEAESFLVYESYIHNLARNHIILSEKVDDITNKQFIERVTELMKEFTSNVDERVVFPKKTDEEVMKENLEAASAMELDEQLKP